MNKQELTFVDGLVNKANALQRSLEIATKNAQGFAVKIYDVSNDSRKWVFGEVHYPESPKLIELIALYRNQTGFSDKDALPMDHFIDLYHLSIKSDENDGN